jgi:hypothetical protein
VRKSVTKRDGEVHSSSHSQVPHQHQTQDVGSGGSGADSPSRWIDETMMDDSSPPPPSSSGHQPYSNTPPSHPHHERERERERPTPPRRGSGYDLPPISAALADTSSSRSHSPPHFHSSHTSYPPAFTNSPSFPSTPAHHPHPPHHHQRHALSPPPNIPTLHELERHYAELRAERGRLEDMLARTDRIMKGVQRGIEEMRAGGSAGGEAAERLRRREEKVESGSVWAWQAQQPPPPGSR